MPAFHSGSTRPSRVETQKVLSQKPSLQSGNKRKINFRWIAFGFLACALLAVATAGGALAGYQSAISSLTERHSQQLALTLTEQFFLTDQDIGAGRFEVARQRLEYILAKNPSFPGASQKLEQVLAILFATATPTITSQPTVTGTATPTQTLTPTRDLRPVQDLFSQAQTALADEDWNKALETLSSLRTSDSSYEVAKVDGMFFIALRNLGVDKILKGHDLEGGSYDLALAERFGPLDARANNARELARLYMYGSAFWEAYPAQAVYYFGQVAAAAPYLTDASNWTAIERLRASLIQYGDQLAAQESWCDAQAQYEQAIAIRSDNDLNSKLQNAALKCSPLIETPTLTPTPTPTETYLPTIEYTPTLSPSLTPTLLPPTASATSPASPTPTQEATQFLPSDTPTPTVPATPTPTFEPTQPSDTPQPPTATLEPPTATQEEPSATPEPPTDTPAPTEAPTVTETKEPG